MKQFIISVGCEYGCGGIEIGKILAKHYNIAYYDRELVDEIIEEAGFSKEITEAAESGADVKGRDKELQHTQSPTKYGNLTKRVVYIQSEAIKKLASRSSCVFIGRCSDYILREWDNCLNVFVYAPYETRIQNLVERNGLTKEDAITLIEKNDEMMHQRYKQMTGTYRGDRHNRHMMIDSSVLGIEGTAKYIEVLIDQLFGDEN